MSQVTVELSMSLDGFIAGPNDGPENGLGDGGDRLFKWYSSGDTNFSLPGTEMVFKISQASSEFLRPVLLGGGVSLFGYLGTGPIELERIKVVEGIDATHLRFRVVK